MNTFNPENFLILVVDDLRQNLLLLMEMLEKVGYATTFANSGQAAIERVKNVKPDLILLDLMMPGMDGLEVCQHLQEELSKGEITVIFLTASRDDEHLLKAFEYGAVDYINKPYKTQEILARIKTHLELKHTKDQLMISLKKEAELVKQLEKLSLTDTLTNIPNRRYIMSLITKQFDRARLEEVMFSILILDLDRFKHLNDVYGHLVGDELLKHTAKVIKKYLRPQDHVGRFGGEEFIVLLPETATETALLLGERLRNNIAVNSLLLGTHSLKVTVSIGVASFRSEDTTINKILSRADQGLYQAKQQGRDRVVMI